MVLQEFLAMEKFKDKSMKAKASRHLAKDGLLYYGSSSIRSHQGKNGVLIN